MSDLVCDLPDCTISQTGVCLRSYSAVAECPHHRATVLGAETESRGALDPEGAAVGREERPTPQPVLSMTGEAVLTAPDDRSALPRSGTLGLREADALMRSRYVNLVGILGLPGAGKTACIASLYLLLAHGALQNFSYLDSKTLMALEEISRGARRWNEGNAPTQMTSHTELSDDRQAGFLHLRLRRNEDGRKFDVLMPDLPGEWSKSLIDNNDADRLAFLKAAEVLWLLVDGRSFLDGKTRQLGIHRATLLIERLASVLHPRCPRIILVASWHDQGEFPAQALQEIQEYGAQHGFKIDFAAIASFSTSAEVPPGVGLAELVATTLALPQSRPDPWPESGSSRTDRAFLRFPGGQ